MNRARRPSFTAITFTVLLAAIAVVMAGLALWRSLSRLPASMDMGASGEGTRSLLTLRERRTATGMVRRITLTATQRRIEIAPNVFADALTFNGKVPGPSIEATVGDHIIATVVNQTTVGLSVHWHGLSVPNSQDGVAGVTQDAIPPGKRFVYSFVAPDSGTYWYHSHQHSFHEVLHGLYGALIIRPRSNMPDVRDYVVMLHEWKPNDECFTCAEVLTLNDRAGDTRVEARAGSAIRLRVINAGFRDHRFAVIGAPVRVTALDGHELNGPTPITQKVFEIGAGQRFDVTFAIPKRGAVTVVDSAIERNGPSEHPRLIIGDTSAQPSPILPESLPAFDELTYGVPSSGALTLTSPFTKSFNLTLEQHLGFFNQRFGMNYTIDGKTFPRTPMMMVREGDLVRIHMENLGPESHPMHLHGHTFTLLERNGRTPEGSPILLDTVLVHPNESVDIGFRADNPGLWMFHCHNLQHASKGMDAMLDYEGISTPFRIGSATGNIPE